MSKLIADFTNRLNPNFSVPSSIKNEKSNGATEVFARRPNVFDELRDKFVGFFEKLFSGKIAPERQSMPP